MDDSYYGTYKLLSHAVDGEQLDRPAQIGSLNLKHTVDKYWVVLYSPKLTRVFGRTFNTEWFKFQAGAIDYLDKYVCKCHGVITVELIRDSGLQWCDDIRHFQGAPYLSPSEALWQIYRYDIVNRSLRVACNIRFTLAKKNKDNQRPEREPIQCLQGVRR